MAGKWRAAGSVLSIAVLLSLGACSSAPPRSDTVTSTKDEAASAAISGQQYYDQGRYDLALQFFVQALDENASVDNVDGVIRSRISIGQVYLALDRVDAAEDMLTRARAQARTRNQSLFIDSSINLGELYLGKDDPKKALEIFQQALDAGGTKLTPGQSGVLFHDIGSAWKSSGDLAKALEWLTRSLQGNLQNKLLAQAAADYYMIASVYSKKEDFETALSNANLALGLDKKTENSPGIAKDLFALGLISAKKKDVEGAYDYFQRAYGVFATLGAKDGVRKSLAELIPIAQSTGRDADAQVYQQALDKVGAK